MKDRGQTVTTEKRAVARADLFLDARNLQKDKKKKKRGGGGRRRRNKEMFMLHEAQ